MIFMLSPIYYIVWVKIEEIFMDAIFICCKHIGRFGLLAFMIADMGGNRYDKTINIIVLYIISSLSVLVP